MTEMMADKPSVREFMRGFRERWFTAMSGGASVPFAIASVLSPEKYQQLIFATLAITCAGFACFRVWKHERERVNELEESLRPKIGVSLDQICGGLRIVKTDYVEGSRVRPGPDHKWAQINITPLTNAPLVDCEVRVTSAEQWIDTQWHLVENEPIYCTWSNPVYAAELVRMTIPSGITQPVNVLSMPSTSRQVIVQTNPAKVQLQNVIKNPGKFRFRVAASARDAKTEHATFIFEWDGAYDSLKFWRE